MITIEARWLYGMGSQGYDSTNNKNKSKLIMCISTTSSTARPNVTSCSLQRSTKTVEFRLCLRINPPRCLSPFCSHSQQRDVLRIRSKLGRPQYKWPLNWQDAWEPSFLSQKNIDIPVSFFFFQITHIRSWYWESVSTAPGQRQLCMASRTTRIQLYESTRWMTMAKLLCRSGNHPVA